MKKITFCLALVWISILSFAQTRNTDWYAVDPYDLKIKQEATEMFKGYSGIIEATVLETRLDSLNGEWINQIKLKIHRIYKGAFDGEIVTVNMLPPSKLIYEKTGIKVPEEITSHGDGIILNPVEGITSIFFLAKGRHNISDSWYIRKWNGYPNEAHYRLQKKDKGEGVDYPSYDMLYKYGLSIYGVDFDSIDELRDYINAVFGAPITTFSEPDIVYFAPPSPFVPKINVDSLDSVNKIRGQEMNREFHRKIELRRKQIEEGEKKPPKRSP